jgi:PAS domain S-box-containing protein
VKTASTLGQKEAYHVKKKSSLASIHDQRIAYRLTLSFALMGIIPILLSTYIIATIWLPDLNVWTQVGLLLSFSLVISILGYLLSRTIVYTILKTSEVAKEIADGNLSKRIEIHNERSEINSLVESFNKITGQLERKIKDVQASEEKFKHLVNNVPDLLYYLQPDGTISSLNDEVKDLLGFEKEELLGQPISTIVHPEDYDKYEPVLKERRSDERRLTRNLHIRLRTKSNSYKVFEINSRGIYSEGGSSIFAGTEALARDITAQLAIESEREEFFYMLTHDIKNPVSAILFIIYMMKDGTIPPAKFSEYYEKIEYACNGIANLVEDFLEFKKLERRRAVMNFQKFNMTALVKNIVATYQAEAEAKGKNLSLTARVTQSPVLAVADERYFARAVENLITNAIKFAQRDIEIALTKTTELITISVRDDGPGVPESEKEHIFQLFHRSPGSRMTKGIGIGLASAEKIVHAHRGVLRVQSEPGPGCSFIITIPVNLVESSPEPATDTSEPKTNQLLRSVQ